MLENTERILPYDMTIDRSDVIYYGGHTGRKVLVTHLIILD
ncbi:MAG: hypothetical protein CM15mP32_4740 [Flavobacteriaceae bacterium]|nr:MAG: hypothetical protein CM15mP32_4740 [Flavobacteriaceae bacterium]